VELIAELDKRNSPDGQDALRQEVAERLRQEVEQMKVNNFIVRPFFRIADCSASLSRLRALHMLLEIETLHVAQCNDPKFTRILLHAYRNTSSRKG
jgi:hypothetical protein